MVEYLDYFNPAYFLFAICAVIAVCFLSIGTITGFMAFVFLFMACGIFVCHVDF